MTRRRTWRPGAPAGPLPNLGDVGATRWGDGSVDHIAVFRPLCGEDEGRCDRPAMIWTRCGPCRRVFARCTDHTAASGHEVHEARRTHDCKAPDAKVIDLAAARVARRASP